ncbi:RNA 2',3'-cyclic phosphodiesterase [Noviherbaspirillum galbum]|uniref:RNA 2',3'-cyclic phosphodiesterase n=1 Tax=Noviherbaspirillum galbum TaxID=2709383 RepID=A0A6B3SQ54_9BURK|nr:RNA 2',3'-cyclic phosphodiesterase [Noviherbaspirillum galbum]NEX60542.1 RNA 2',3'-cyclic phosphodiesterase [Noviherbaspirillum galbum]
MNATSSETMRLFYALWPDNPTRTTLMQLQAPLHGRMIPYENLHLTLAFLGEQPVSRLPALKEILLRLNAAPGELVLDRVSYFTRNRIVWAGASETPPFVLTLYRELSEALMNQGVAFNEQHAFKPHITLARDASSPPDLAFAPIRWRAHKVALVRSENAPQGSRYEVLASRSLDEKWVLKDLPGGGA